MMHPRQKVGSIVGLIRFTGAELLVEMNASRAMKIFRRRMRKIASVIV